MSVEVKAQNTISMTSVKAIKDATDEANTLLDGMRQSAIDAGTTLNGIYQDAMDAQTSADNAQASADSASEYATRAYANLSTVQNITETLNWITAHGTMTLTSDTQLDPSHVYFVADQNGDYVVGGQHYSVVSEPDVADISTYYELSIDESLNNYVATHLVVDSEGLWIIPDAGGNKVLIATGQGSTYTSAGTYIIGKVNNVDTVLAQFTSDGAIIGQTGESHLEMDYHSLKLIDKEGNPYFYVSDLRDESGEVTLTYTDVVADTAYFVLPHLPTSIISVTINGQTASYVEHGQEIEITSTIAEGDILEVVYITESSDVKAYTFGIRNELAEVGAFSYAEGADVEASGFYSHAVGYKTSARGACSHAQNYHTIAGYGYQTVIGAYNDNHANNAFEIGNGTADNARSNALSVDWSGNVEASGDVSGTDVNASGNVTANDMLIDLPDYQTASTTDKAIYDALVALGWDSDVLVN